MSPRGSASFTRHAAAVEQRREQAMTSFGPQADYFSVSAGQFCVVRFLEQGEELAYAAVHRVQFGNSRYPNDVICLDQNDDGSPCPFCSSDDKEVRSRSTKGYLNLIWRGGDWIQQVNQQILAQNQQRVAQGQNPYLTYTLAPVYKRSQNGFPEKDQSGAKIVTGYADGIFLWKCSNTVFQELLSKDQTWRGLMSRDFTVRRQGSSMQDTVYYLEPYNVEGGEQPMSAADQALAQNKYDLDAFITPPSFEDARKMLSGGSQGPTGTFMRGGGQIPAGGLAPAVPNTGGAGSPFDLGGSPMKASVPPIPPQ